jgi:hypothetical protein
VAHRAVSSSRVSKSSRGHSTASDLATNPSGRVRSGDAAGSRDAAAASVDEVPAGRMPHPPDKPYPQQQRLTSFFDPAPYGEHRSRLWTRCPPRVQRLKGILNKHYEPSKGRYKRR